MQDFLFMLGICSITMSLVALLFLILSPLLSRKYSPKWQYYTWLVIVIGLIIPFRSNFDFAVFKVDMPAEQQIVQQHEQQANRPAEQQPINDSIINPIVSQDIDSGIVPEDNSGAAQQAQSLLPDMVVPDASVPDTAASVPTASPAASFHIPEVSLYQIIFFVWVAGIVFIAVYNLIRHYRFMRTVNRWSETVTNEKALSALRDTARDMAIFNNVNLKVCPFIKSPMMIGYINPTIIVNTNTLFKDEFVFIIRHELTHYKRKDLWYKSLVLVAEAIHWFNPIVYFISKEIALQCEISCDWAVVQNESSTARQQYSETIIGVIKRHTKLRTEFSTSFYGGKEGMKKRIFSIMDTAVKKAGAIVVCSAIIMTLGTGMLVSANTINKAVVSSGNSTNQPKHSQTGTSSVQKGKQNTAGISYQGEEQIKVTFDDDTPSVTATPPPNTTTPPNPSNMAANTISVGSYHSMTIKSDGSLWGWGNNASGQLGIGVSGDILTEPVKIMDDVKSVSAGHGHTMAIKSDGSLWAWGDNDLGQLGDGTIGDQNKHQNQPVKIMDGVISVSAGYYHTMAIKSDGSLWAWGWNANGRLGNGTDNNNVSSRPIKIMDGVKSVSAGYDHTMAIKADGSLWAWGGNSNGNQTSDKLGDETTANNITSPVKIMDNVASVSAGYVHTMAIKTDGSLWAWGNNYSGQLGNGAAYGIVTEPTKITDGVKSVSAGMMNTVIIKTDGSLWVCGDNRFGQIGDNTSTNRNTFVKIMDGAASAAMGSYFGIASKTDGSIWTWGYNSEGELGDGTTTDRAFPVKILDMAKVTFDDGANKTETKVTFDGDAGKTETKVTFDDDTPPVQTKASEKTVAAGYSINAALKPDGSLWVWGNNEYGQLGDGTYSDSTSPIRIMGNVKSVSAGGHNIAAIKTDGSLWAWGTNWTGQLGNGTFIDSNTPVKITDNVKSVSVGYHYIMFIKNDGSLWGIGSNNYGQLGNGTNNDALFPVKVMSDVKSVSAGIYHTVAVKTDGSLWAWGYNDLGELGDGTNNDRNVPIKIMDNVACAAAGDFHTAAVKTDGSLWSWGFNGYGQLGDGTTTSKTVPTKIMDGVKNVYLGTDSYTLALKTDGSLWKWGVEDFGGMLNENKVINSTPQKVMVGVADASVSIGGYHNLILKTDGSLWIWGQSLYGRPGEWEILNSPLKKMDGVRLP